MLYIGPVQSENWNNSDLTLSYIGNTMRVTHTGSYLQQLVMVYSLLVVNIRVIYLKHMFAENTIHLCIDRNIQPNVTAGIVN